MIGSAPILYTPMCLCDCVYTIAMENGFGVVSGQDDGDDDDSNDAAEDDADFGGVDIRKRFFQFTLLSVLQRSC